MSYYTPDYAAGATPQNLQFIPSNYATAQSGGSGTMGSASGSYMYGSESGGQERLSTGILAAFGTSGYPGEPPLLEELGVNFGHIQQKTMTVLNPFRSIDQHIMDDSDLAGPILFCLLFATFLLLSGKVHFGYIYGVALMGTLSLYAILNLMAMKSIDMLRTASVLGYCLLPLVATSAIGVVVPLDNALGYFFSAFVIFWCTYSSSAIFVSYLQLSQMRVLVAYPLALFYGIFSIMTLFVEKQLSGK
ncbi:protein transport protein Yip1p [Trichomonascus vanleenenianus]|uniref:transporter YIP1 n=1 Tax=Trichomonascus vanleenenianus TaxID=2268995 RepID=UPI003ECB782A